MKSTLRLWSGKQIKWIQIGQKLSWVHFQFGQDYLAVMWFPLAKWYSNTVLKILIWQFFVLEKLNLQIRLKKFFFTKNEMNFETLVWEANQVNMNLSKTFSSSLSIRPRLFGHNVIPLDKMIQQHGFEDSHLANFCRGKTQFTNQILKSFFYQKWYELWDFGLGSKSSEYESVKNFLELTFNSAKTIWP